MKTLFLTAIWLLLFNINSFAADSVDVPLFSLENMFDGKGAPWSLSTDQFAKEYENLRFHWGSAVSKDTMKLIKGAVSFTGKPVVEVTVRLKDEKVSEIIMSLYNRGDLGNLGEKEFSDLVESFAGKINIWLGVHPVKTQGVLGTAGTEKQGLVWTRKPDQFKMEWAWTRANRTKGYPYRSEYIRLSCQKYDASTDYSSSILANKMIKGGTVSASDLKKNITADAAGDVFIDGIPMVDQGLKGYCVVATMERIMLYFGRQVDQHELAQMANSIASQGTLVSEMIDALRKISVELGFKVTIYEEWTWSKYQKLVENYNRQARKQGKPQIVIPQSGVINIAVINEAMATDVLRDVKVSDKVNYKKFMSNVTSSVNRGIPLVWSVTTGRVSESPPVQQVGGHMRMIVGYNLKTSEIIYSDTWGPGHEKKRMSADDAWLITDGLYVLLPRRMSI